LYVKFSLGLFRPLSPPLPSWLTHHHPSSSTHRILANNPLGDNIPDSLANLTKLNYVQLRGIGMTRLPRIFGPGLREMYIDSNPFELTLAEFFETLADMKATNIEAL
jgi:hypothetical protein